MCGISAIWGDSDVAVIERMNDLMVHRGPDAHGVFVSLDGRTTLGHRRLSIMDPQGGDQPIFNEDKSKAIIANGEIYNFPRLKNDLARGHRFSTTSDSEAILHQYEDSASHVVDHLDGMFSFVISDQNAFFAARDPIGIKPLYYGYLGNSMVFASELKAFPSNCRDIKEFPPGTCFHSEQGFSSFYRVPNLKSREGSVEEYCKKIRSTLEAAVEKRLMSDVPLGAFLSGGLDSSVIAALAKRSMGSLHTFSVGIEGSKDLEAARVVARHIDSIHHEYVITPREVKKELPKIIYYLESFDQDLVRSAIPCYFTSRLAAEYVKVILTGEGADELFGGYTYYKDIKDPDILQNELRRSVSSLHNINLQRVDRMTMAHSIEGRVPFLDLKMIEMGMLVPAEYKLVGSPPVEKWILRKAVEDLLPDEIVWRKKEQFDEGSGTVDLVSSLFAEYISEEEAHKYSDCHRGDNLRSAEECYYHQLLLDAYESPDLILANIGRWAERPSEIQNCA